MRKYAKVTTREVLDSFHSDSEYGLSTTSVSSLKKTYGSNKLPGEVKVRHKSHFTDFILFSLFL
jgi:hypothetical protein